jgi:fructokinase
MRIGIDLGGTKIEGIFLDKQGDTLARRRLPTPAGSYPETVRAIVELVNLLEAAAGSRGTVGVGMPGAISPKTGVVKNANSTWLNGRPLDRDLEAALGRPVRLANDADCFALSEATDGAGAGAPVVFGVILGTGVGGGIVVDGRLLRGADAIAGEWGHNPLPWPEPGELPGPPCYCGKAGCLETFLSGPGLARDHGQGLTGEEVAARAAAGEPAARVGLDRYADRLARGLASVVNVLDPHAIVLGGGLSRIDALYETVPSLMSKYVFSDRVAARLLPPRHGDASGVRGAAWLW